MSYVLTHLPGTDALDLPPVPFNSGCCTNLARTSSSIWSGTLPPVSHATSGQGSTWPLAHGPQSRVPRGSWYTHSKAVQAQVKVLASEEQWKQQQRQQQLRLHRLKHDEARRQALTRGEIFPSRQLAAKRAAAAVQRACDAAAAAEVVFLPTDASARAIAERTWAHEPCKLDKRARDAAVADVADLMEHESIVYKISIATASTEKAKSALVASVRKEPQPVSPASKTGGVKLPGLK